MADTNIEWTHIPGYTGRSWNPVTGCTKIAAGCKHCYAETLATRFWGDRKFTDVRTHADRLDEPLRRRKATCYFVNSMSDLFHKDVPFEFIAAVYGVMAACPQHLFIILTKRPKRMREFNGSWAMSNSIHSNLPEAVLFNRVARKVGNIPAPNGDAEVPPWPLPNVIHGYSAATQADLDAGAADLLATSSARRCLSLEPLIGPIDLNRLIRPYDGDQPLWPCSEPLLTGIDWVLVGGESGPGARPCDVAWIRSIVEQCKAASVPCFVKQLGSNPLVFDSSHAWGGTALSPCDGPGGPDDYTYWRVHLKDKKGGNPNEWEAGLRVREWPTTK